MFEHSLTEPLEWEKTAPKAVQVKSSGDDEVALMRRAAEEF